MKETATVSADENGRDQSTWKGYLQFIRWRWMELFFYSIGYLCLVWAALGNPTRGALIAVSGRANTVKVVPHMLGSRTVTFHAGSSKALKYASGFQVDQLDIALRRSPHVDALVWPGATAPDNDYYAGEIVELELDGLPFMSYVSWWRSHAGDLALRMGLAVLFGGSSLWCLGHKPPMSAEAGRKLPPRAMAFASRSAVVTILLVSIAVLVLLIALTRT